MTIGIDGREIRCDHHDCASILRWPGRNRPSPAELRRLSIEMSGWSRDGRGGDRCPAHPDRRMTEAAG